MKKLLMAAVLATLAFTTIACGPPAGTTTKTGTSPSATSMSTEKKDK